MESQSEQIYIFILHESMSTHSVNLLLAYAAHTEQRGTHLSSCNREATRSSRKSKSLVQREIYLSWDKLFTLSKLRFSHL